VEAEKAETYQMATGSIIKRYLPVWTYGAAMEAAGGSGWRMESS